MRLCYFTKRQCVDIFELLATSKPMGTGCLKLAVLCVIAFSDVVNSRCENITKKIIIDVGELRLNNSENRANNTTGRYCKKWLFCDVALLLLNCLTHAFAESKHFFHNLRLRNKRLRSLISFSAI